VVEKHHDLVWFVSCTVFNIKCLFFGIASFRWQKSTPRRFSSSNLIEYFCEFESTCKTVLAHESGDPGVQFNEKTEGRKSRDTVPLKFNVQRNFSKRNATPRCASLRGVAIPRSDT
jgi:hypothetical protein